MIMSTMRQALIKKGISAAAAASLLALVQGCAMQPAQTQSATDYAPTDSAAADSAVADSATADHKSSERTRWAKAHDHKRNPYFHTATSTTAGSVTVDGNAIHYHAVAGLLIVHPKSWNDASAKSDGDDPSMGPSHGHHPESKSPEASMFYVAYFKDGGRRTIGRSPSSTTAVPAPRPSGCTWAPSALAGW